MASTGRENMDERMGQGGAASDNGHLGSVDEVLAREFGGRPATWHGRRFGHAAVNVIAARIITAWREHGDLAELALWARPIEEALAGMPHPDAEHRADLADAREDVAQSGYRANPCAETARALLRARAAVRRAELDHDRLLAERYGLEL